MIRKSLLPDIEFGAHPMRKSSLDQTNSSLQSDHLRSNQQVNMIGHDDKVVKKVLTLATIVLQRLQKEFRMR